MLKRIFKIVAYSLGLLFAVLVGLAVYVNIVARIDEPTIKDTPSLPAERKELTKDFYTLGNNWLRKSESGLFEMYVEGDPYAIGLAIGKLAHEQVQFQEEAFTKQIHRLVPSNFYLGILRYFVGWFNRNLDSNVEEEYKQEIYGISQASSHEFDDIAPPYQRILNYHAAHDIGHALQNMSLVGCTSFATWNENSEDSTLIIGRNFDFYVGDDFARDKIIAFYNPVQGHKFMMVTFGGMTGVLSGMNVEGLTVTINAAKADMPSSSATPVSLVAREILQYASTIKEAHAIAKKRKMFVAESFLIGSAKDKKAAIIEKNPDAIDLFESETNQLVCTNHFQGKLLGNTETNKEHMRTSASVYRNERVKELLKRNRKNSVAKTAAILRNQLGLNDTDIGLGNEKSINQLIAHHGIIFQPEKRLVWVSTAPWQLGKFVCYNLDDVFNLKTPSSNEIYKSDLTLPADSFLLSPLLTNYLRFAPYRFPFQPKDGIQPDSLIHQNPNSYLAYLLAGDFYFNKNELAKASQMYELGMRKEVATQQEMRHMKKRLAHCQNKLQ